MRYLNLGCGNEFREGWINVDFKTTDDGVLAHDLNEPLPFESDSFDVVYHSHVLEHFPKQRAASFVDECYRVLRPGGVIRVAVPDLEGIARLYLQFLDKLRQGKDEFEFNYDWMMLEMYDQAVRTRTGGEMRNLLLGEAGHDRAFIVSRMGHRRRTPCSSYADGCEKREAGHRRPGRLLDPRWYRERLLRVLLGGEYRALQVGRFRTSGETHQWMYDSYSLERLLRHAGFIRIRRCRAAESCIPNWQSWHLDVNADGTVRKPDSLFMEGDKAERSKPIQG